MTALAKSFGSALRRLRTDAGFSQDDFALASGFHRTYIGRVERGEANVGLENIARLARALGLSASDLVRAAESNAVPGTAEPIGDTAGAGAGMTPAVVGQAERK